jgi:hypothetical protein
LNERLTFAGHALVLIALLFVLASFAVLLTTRGEIARPLAQVGALAVGAGVGLQLVTERGSDSAP